MQFIYILTLDKKYHDLKNRSEETNTIQGGDFNYLKSLFERGVVKHVGRTDLDFGDDNLHGCAIFEARDESMLKIL